MGGIIFLVVVILASGMIPGGVSFLAARWCLERRLKMLYIPLTALLAAGTAYGFLRLTGLLIFAEDHRSSFLFWGSTWREKGIRWLFLCGSSLMGVLTAFWAGKGEKLQNIKKKTGEVEQP